MSPTKSPRPRFSEEEAAALAAELYGMSGQVQELASERDQNFSIRIDGETRYVLKIANARERREVLELQTQAVRHLAGSVPEFIWPDTLRTMAGEDIAVVKHREGTDHFVRLLTYLPGAFFAQVKPHKPELLQSLGIFLASMDRAFASFHHPAARRDLKWNMRLAPSTIRSRLADLTDREGRAIVEYFLGRFENTVSSKWPRLRTSVIHNDANDLNVLVGHLSAHPDGLYSRVVGIIDFGDMVEGSPVIELAVGAAYAIMGKNDPLAAAVPIVSGYHEFFPLTEEELACLYDLIAIRLCLSVVISAEQRKVEVDNEYLSISEKPAWELLRRWRGIDPGFAHYTFREASGLTPNPHTQRIVSWLEKHRKGFGPVVEVDLEKDAAILFDLSVGSPELSDWTDPDDMEELSALLFRRMACSNARVGVGRYNEARRLYTSDLFKTDGNDAPEWRSVHLGIDLYLDPGSAVLAPLDGIVHSFGDNGGRLDYGPTIILEHTAAECLKFYTLYGHLTRESLSGLAAGRKVRKGERVGRIGDLSENGGWPPHLHFQIITGLLGYEGDFPGVASPSRRAVWLSLCPDPNLILKAPEELMRPKALIRDREEILDVRRRHLGPNLSVSYRRPLKIVRGFRQYLYDDHGQAYLDAVNNVPHVGHCHPGVVRAAREQMAVLNTNTRYLHDHLVEYALRLKELLPEPLSVFFFVCSGSEANDLALRLARTHTQQRDTIVVDGAYHGNLTSLIEISPYKFDGPGGRGAPPYVHKVPTPDGYRGLYKNHDPEAGKKYARHVQEAIARIQEQGNNVAAFIAESLMGSAGQIVYPPGFLEEAFSRTRRSGGVCIADEVQVGFGRVGTHFWGFETQGVVPDIVTMGKPIGNGHPLAAVATTPEIAASFKTGMEYFNTFGGNPVSCAVGLAVLDILQEENLQRNAFEVGRDLKAGLEGLKTRHRLVGDVRGLGLFLGVEFVLDRESLAPASAEAAFIAERMRDKRILVSTDGPYRNVVKIKPPLVFTKDDADLLIETLDQILGEDALRLP
ncbi:MAG TPA: aminotransferase class III-fold pyridoxal phosphate-dependent enzyme [Candidatus Desulfaltia sp.]|nr:aminotransferase class III-fold pyridoxal phosphate-dependent enzyme [Candidatus Desulfaltia sp.]